MLWKHFNQIFVSDSQEFSSLSVNEFGQQLDLEPNLEFDDSELTTEDDRRDDTQHNMIDDIDDTFLHSDLIEDDFEDHIPTEDPTEEEDFADIARHSIVEVCGDDQFARKVITIYASRLPDRRHLDHQRLLRSVF